MYLVFVDMCYVIFVDMCYGFEVGMNLLTCMDIFYDMAVIFVISI